jgi:hypothetical protein
MTLAGSPTPSRSNPKKGCLVGTRTAFLDHVIDWVNNPESERVLLLFGHAGTGKSSIAHEVARRFANMDRLASSLTFVRGERSKSDAYKLFTTLAVDLSDRYPSFKIALGNAVGHNRSLLSARDYLTAFQTMLRQPLNDLHIVGPVVVIIDGLRSSRSLSAP